MKAKTLFPPGPALANLTARQSIVFAYLQARPDGKRAIDVGNWLHREKQNPCLYCSEERTCQFASRDSNEVLRSLRARELVIRRKTGLWVALVGVDDGRMDPRTTDWPEGF